MHRLYLIAAGSLLFFGIPRAEALEHPRRFEGYFEEYGDHRLDLIAYYLPANPVIVEGGGHHGTDTILFAKQWPLATIFTFEPYQDSFIRLILNTFRYPNITGYRLALAHYNGIATLNVCQNNLGASSLLESTEANLTNYAGPRIRVPCVVLDTWCQENQIDHIDFLWLDLEGMELQILESSPEILKTVKVIYTETNFEEFRTGMTQYKNLKAFLENAGFTLLAHWYLENHQGDAIFIRS